MGVLLWWLVLLWVFCFGESASGVLRWWFFFGGSALVVLLWGFCAHRAHEPCHRECEAAEAVEVRRVVVLRKTRGKLKGGLCGGGVLGRSSWRASAARGKGEGRATTSSRHPDGHSGNGPATRWLRAEQQGDRGAGSREGDRVAGSREGGRGAGSREGGCWQHVVTLRGAIGSGRGVAQTLLCAAAASCAAVASCA